MINYVTVWLCFHREFGIEYGQSLFNIFSLSKKHVLPHYIQFTGIKSQ
jgi:hypothetical protein